MVKNFISSLLPNGRYLVERERTRVIYRVISLMELTTGHTIPEDYNQLTNSFLYNYQDVLNLIIHFGMSGNEEFSVFKKA